MNSKPNIRMNYFYPVKHYFVKIFYISFFTLFFLLLVLRYNRIFANQPKTALDFSNLIHQLGQSEPTKKSSLFLSTLSEKKLVKTEDISYKEIVYLKRDSGLKIFTEHIYIDDRLEGVFLSSVSCPEGSSKCLDETYEGMSKFQEHLTSNCSKINTITKFGLGMSWRCNKYQVSVINAYPDFEGWDSDEWLKVHAYGTGLSLDSTLLDWVESAHKRPYFKIFIYKDICSIQDKIRKEFASAKETELNIIRNDLRLKPKYSKNAASKAKCSVKPQEDY